MNKELLIYFFNQNWILFAGAILASIMTYISFMSSRFSSLSVDQAIRFINDGAWVIDTREEDAYRKEHIEGASNLPNAKIKEEISSAFEKKNVKDIVFYCTNGSQAIPTIKKLKSLALDVKFHYIQGGINAWKDAQFPVLKAAVKSKKKR